MSILRILSVQRRLYANNGLNYKRKGGGSLGADYHLTDDSTPGTAWNYTRAEMRGNGNKTYDQNIVGTGSC